jgi:hypothetical protein
VLGDPAAGARQLANAQRISVDPESLRLTAVYDDLCDKRATVRAMIDASGSVRVAPVRRRRLLEGNSTYAKSSSAEATN